MSDDYILCYNLDMNLISTNNWSNETHFSWILNPPWKYHNDLFNDITYNNSGSNISFFH